MVTNENCGLSAADVAAVMGANGGNGSNGNGFGGWGNDGAWWIIILFLFAFAGGWGNNNRDGSGGGGNSMVPYMVGNLGTNGDVQRGFDQQAVMGGVNTLSSAIGNGFAGVNQNLCNGFAGVNQAICNGISSVNQGVAAGFANAEIAANSRQIADMQQMFNTQTAIDGRLDNLAMTLQQCCCDNKAGIESLRYTIATEDCATRAAVSDGIRDIITNQTANTQTLINATNSATQGIMDKICQLELNYKDERINQLQTQLTLSQLYASQTDQTAAIIANNAAQTAALQQYLNPAPVPAYVVPNPNGCGCGYGYNAYGGYNNGCCGN